MKPTHNKKRKNIMKKLSLCSCLCLCLFMCLIFFTLADQETCTNNNSTILIQETCKTCSQNDPNLSYDFCVTSLQPGRCAANLRGLGLLSVKLLRRNVTSTRRRVRELLRDRRWDPFARACLEDCFDLYSDSVPTLKDTVRDYKARRYGDANIQLSSVLDASVTCEEGFHEKQGLVSPLTKRNNDTFQLSAMALSVITLLNKVQS